MKFLFDLFPVILFFGVFKWGEAHRDTAHAIATQYLSRLAAGGVIDPAQSAIVLATAAGFALTVAMIAYLLARGRAVAGMLWVSLAVIVVFGGATIYFHNDNFIKWKPTILYWCFTLSLLLSQKFFNINLMRKVMQEQISLPDAVWDRLNLVWMVFFAFMGVLNLFVAFVLFKADTGAWVSFKLFGFMGVFVVFVLGQSFYLAKYITEDKA